MDDTYSQEQTQSAGLGYPSNAFNPRNTLRSAATPPRGESPISREINLLDVSIEELTKQIQDLGAKLLPISTEKPVPDMGEKDSPERERSEIENRIVNSRQQILLITGAVIALRERIDI